MEAIPVIIPVASTAQSELVMAVVEPASPRVRAPVPPAEIVRAAFASSSADVKVTVPVVVLPKLYVPSVFNVNCPTPALVVAMRILSPASSDNIASDGSVIPLKSPKSLFVAVTSPITNTGTFVASPAGRARSISFASPSAVSQRKFASELVPKASGVSSFS